MLRWLVTVVLALAACAAMYFTYDSYNTYRAALSRGARLEAELRDARREERWLLSEVERVNAWNQRWAAISSRALRPGDWFVNGMNVRRAYDWRQLERTLVVISNDGPFESGYWYAPQSFHLSRVMPRGQEDEDGEDGQDQQAEAGAASGSEAEPERFNVRARGEFLIPQIDG